MVTYCESTRRSCSESLSVFSISEGERCAVASDRMMPLTSAAYSAAEGACRKEFRGKLRTRMLRLKWGQQPQLHLAGHCQITLQPLLLLGDTLVEAGIFDGNGNLRGQRSQGALMVFIEEVRTRVLNIENADDLALINKRHGHLGARLRIEHAVARIFANIGRVDQ